MNGGISYFCQLNMTVVSEVVQSGFNAVFVL